ncbi:MAG: MATE family efflux transporter [Clostridiales bacterium]|nr:MATE family efflux transporter [Clostridiales bacterium]
MNSTTNKMGINHVGKMMLTMGIPMILSMILQAVYNIVDSVFVSNMSQNGEEALNALTLAFPVQMMIVAIGIGTGVGVNALLSKNLGQGNIEKVSRVAGNGVFLGIVIYIVFLLFGIFGADWYISTQTTNALIKEMAVDYLKICCIVSFGIVFFSIFEKLLQSTGRSLFSTIAQVAGAVTNIVLDPVMIYGLLGFPEYGVKGAAYATVIGQIVSFVLALIFHFAVNKEIKKSVKYIKPSGEIIKEIYAIGLPAIISQALMSFMTYALNIILVRIGESVVTAYGLFYKVQQFVLFAAFGLRDAITPIVSFNHGLGSKERVKSGIKYGLIYTIIIMLAGTIVLEIFADSFAGMFDISGGTQDLFIGALRVISISFVFAGINIALQGVFQALNGGTESLAVSVYRQFLFVIPVAYGFSFLVINSIENIWVVWTTFIIAEVLTVIIAAVFMKRIYKKRVSVLK